MPSSEQFSGTRQSRGHWEQQTQSLPRLWWVQSPQWWDWEGRKTLSQCLCVCWVSRRFSCSLGWACFRPIRTSSPHLPPLLSCQSSAVSYGLECRQGLGPFSDSDFFFFFNKSSFFFFSFLWILYWGEKAMAPHSSTLAWKILWTEEPGGLQSMESERVRQDCMTKFSLSL